MNERLKLMAEDVADLEVISAAAQDALVRVGDLAYDKKARRFSALVSRFRWEKSGGGGHERIQAALAFDGVLNVKSRKLRLDTPDAVASILQVKFQADEEPPGGVVRLVLAGDGEIALGVECLDVVLSDMGDAWMTPRKPDHEKSA